MHTRTNKQFRISSRGLINSIDSEGESQKWYLLHSKQPLPDLPSNPGQKKACNLDYNSDSIQKIPYGFQIVPRDSCFLQQLDF